MKRRTRTVPKRSGLLVPILAALVLDSGEGSATHAAEVPARGFAYRCDRVAEGPWSIHIVTVSRTHPDIELQTSLAQGTHLGLAPLSEQMKQFPRELGRPVAAVNGDYYWDEGACEGDPKGLQIMNGELISAPCGWSAFWIDAAGQPQTTNVTAEFELTWPDGRKLPFGLNEDRGADAAVLYSSAVGDSTHTRDGLDLILRRDGDNPWLPLQAGRTCTAQVAELRESGNAPVTTETMVLSLGPKLLADLPQPKPGDRLRLTTATSPDLGGVRMAIGGGPVLVRDGRAIARDEVRVRNPRTAVGWDRDNYYLLQVDGRQRHVSEGMTTDELSDYLVRLGCESAMSLDGGGSATCWFYGQVMNQPSEGFERDMANALVVVRKPRQN
ncbi:MAG: phosphodiester glycosidase family protein [Verrucomicrobiales bacterium]|nr:phosphodiester glycosidase family protein [Verrucomicrobiales bacterium]